MPRYPRQELETSVATSYLCNPVYLKPRVPVCPPLTGGSERLLSIDVADAFRCASHRDLSVHWRLRQPPYLCAISFVNKYLLSMAWWWFSREMYSTFIIFQVDPRSVYSQFLYSLELSM